MKVDPDRAKFLWYAYYPFTAIVVAFGILGNIFSLLVWKSIKRKSKTAILSAPTYFIMLSYVDITVLVLTIFVFVLPKAHPDLLHTYAFAWFISYIAHPFHFYTAFVSIYIVLAMSIERARLVYKPCSRNTITKQYTRYVLIFAFGLAAIFNIPTWLEYKSYQEENGEWLLKEIRYKNNITLRNVVFIAHCVGVVIVPWLIMLVSNVILLRALSKRILVFKPNTVSLPTMSTEFRQVTFTLIVVTSATLIFFGVQCVARCITMFIYIDDPSWPNIWFAREIGNLGIPLNSALNFLLFSIPGKMFRQESRRLLRQLTSCYGNKVQQCSLKHASSTKSHQTEEDRCTSRGPGRSSHSTIRTNTSV